MAIDIGISEEDRKSIVDGLSRLLSDTYVLYLKTHNFHWNVTGPMFRTLHLMFEEQYTELALAVDSIAERIRALGFPAPGAYSIYARLSSIKEEEGVPSAEEMIKQLVAGQEAQRNKRAAPGRRRSGTKLIDFRAGNAASTRFSRGLACAGSTSPPSAHR